MSTHSEGYETGEMPRKSNAVAGATEVVTIGETMMLFWPTDGEGLEDGTRYERSFGGAETNFCIALARLGTRPRWISRLGDDAFGRHIRFALEREGVDVVAATDPTAPTAVFFKERVTVGPRRVAYYRRGSAASRLAPADVRAQDFAGVRLLHLTGITPALSSSCAAAVDRAIALARDANATVSVDPNVRLQVWPDPDACRAALLALIERADIVLIGHEDAEILFPGLSGDDVLAAVQALGPSTAVLKRGERGACALRRGERAEVPACPTRVVDTVGAGDGFDAGFVAGWLRDLSLRECLALGARIGAAAVSVAGDWEGYPRAREVGLAPR